MAKLRGRPGKPNQRKADSQAGSRIWGVFVNSGVVPGKTRRIHKNRCSSRIWGNLGGRGGCEFSLFFQEKHSEFTKTLQIREPACESAFLWFGLPGRPLRNMPLRYRSRLFSNRIFSSVQSMAPQVKLARTSRGNKP